MEKTKKGVRQPERDLHANIWQKYRDKGKGTDLVKANSDYLS